MASRAHRWKGDDHPLTGVHGGNAKRALLAVKESKRLLYERARAAVREVIARNTAVSEGYQRKDRRRPRATMNVYPYQPARPQTFSTERIEIRTRAEVVWDACKGYCVYCGFPMIRMADDPSSFSIDHDIPKCRGGTNALSNLVGAHKSCNNEKGSLTGEEYRLVLAKRRG